MDIAQRLIAAALLALCSWSATAQTCTIFQPTGIGGGSGNPYTPVAGPYATALEACQANAATLTPWRADYGRTVTVDSITPSGGDCNILWHETYGGTTEHYTNIRGSYSQNQGSGSQCPATCPSAGTSAGGASVVLYAAGGTGGLAACYAGCAVTSSVAGTDSSGTYFAGPFTHTGVACNGTGTAGPTVQPSPEPLAPGRCPGSINGTAVPGGVPCGTVTTAGPSTTTQTPQGAASAPPGVTAGSSTSTTTCSNGSCTTTVNYYGGGGPGGSPTGTSTTNEPQTDYCAKNPNAPQCKDEEQGSWGGSCGGGFTCDGDAIQCAIANDQYRRHCQLFDTPNEFSTIGAGAMNGQAQPQGHPGAAPDVVSLSFPSAISQTNLLPGSCPGDISIPFIGEPIVIPISDACGSLELLGQLLVGISMLAALAIVFR